MDFVYDPMVCDLCGSRDYTDLLRLSPDRSMRSDRGVVAYKLSKFICTRCGLVRSGQSFDDRQLQDYYMDDYVLSEQPEHYFYTKKGPVSRSKMICDWITSSMGTFRWQTATSCLEIGAGSGALMQEFIQHFPQVDFEGAELSKHAAILAQNKGLSVYQSTITDLSMRQYDIIYAIAVIEHVPSPTDFLNEIRKRLPYGAWLFLIQPTQDIASYDLFFFDHLHHFGSEHLRQYARKCGFREQGLVVGHEWMPNFSLHLWQAFDRPDDFAWLGPPGYTTCPATAERVVADMARLDSTLARLAKEHRRTAVFGLNEVYWLARAYSSLGDFGVVCGLDDTPGKPEYSRLGFPVLIPEECLALHVQDVILAMNKVYYDQARERLERLGLTVHPILS